MFQHRQVAVFAQVRRGVREVLALGAFLAAAAAVGQTLVTRADSPEIKVGDHWKQEQKDKRTGNKESEINRTVTAVTATLVEGTENDGKFAMTSELNPVESTTVVISGDPKFLSFPLEVGKKWSFKYNFANKTNEGKGRVQLDAEVLAYEKVTVPAGSFDAFRIQAKGFWNNDASRQNGRSKFIYWYAPAARSVVRTEYEDGYNNWVRELIELHLQP